MAVNTALPRHALALLDTIYDTESGGRYNIIYGGGTFSDYSDHPRQLITIRNGLNKGKKTSASGAPQFTAPTWDRAKKALGLSDFKPTSQDAAAWWLAQSDYKRRTGQNLLSDLQTESGEVIAIIGAKLSPTWTSLPNGIEQTTKSSDFVRRYFSHLAKYQGNKPKNDVIEPRQDAPEEKAKQGRSDQLLNQNYLNNL